MFGALFFSLLFTVAESAAEALPTATTAEIGVSALRFNYAEYKDDGSTWDKELGSIPGLSFKLTQRISAWEWEGMANYHYGRVYYNGQTNLGAPLSTRTDEMFGDVALRLGRWFEGSYAIMPYAGLGYRRWDRDILSVGNVRGLFESYRWKYAWLGAKVVAYQQGTSQLMLDIGWIRPINPVMYLDAHDLSFNLERRDGLRLMLTSRRALSENTTLIMEPYLEYWQLGNSPRPTPTATHEPESKTKNLGFNFRLGRVF